MRFRTLPAALCLLALLSMLPTASAQPLVVDVELHVISFGNYDVNKGTYTMDFYLHLSYPAGAAPAGFDVSRFEFTNGRAASKDLLSDETVDGVRDVWWRIQGNLYTDPQFKDYPYGAQFLRLVMEDAIHPVSELQYRPVLAGNGLDPDVTVAGWRIDGAGATVGEKGYTFHASNETYSRLTYEVRISRPALSATLRSFLPPVAFLLVASFSFFLDPAQPVPRLTLGTGMLISAVGFHLSQVVNLPTQGSFTPFDKVMVATYAFIVACIMVTVALAWGDKLHIPARVLALTNRWGAVFAVALPVLLFVALAWV